MQNQQIVLKRRPVGVPVLDDFEMQRPDIAALGEDEVLVRLCYLGLEPSARMRMNAESPYSQPIAIGGVVSSTGVGIVVESRSRRLKPGDHVFVHSGWQQYFVVKDSDARRIDVGLASLPQWLSLLGLSSFTAYIGMTELARPQSGETVVVSAASGATGAVAGQIARIMGARVVGIAGGAEKCRYVVDSLGFDDCVDYRQPDFEARLDAACPDGIDVDYENVGGKILHTVFPRMNRYGRVILCGLVAEYNNQDLTPGPNLWRAVYHALRIEGFLASRYWDRIPEFVDAALRWSQAGELRHREHIVAGFDNVPAAFLDLLAGRHLGKVMVELAEN